jgi:hypothetical protein
MNEFAISHYTVAIEMIANKLFSEYLEIMEAKVHLTVVLINSYALAVPSFPTLLPSSSKSL